MPPVAGSGPISYEEVFPDWSDEATIKLSNLQTREQALYSPTSSIPVDDSRSRTSRRSHGRRNSKKKQQQQHQRDMVSSPSSVSSATTTVGEFNYVKRRVKELERLLTAKTIECAELMHAKLQIERLNDERVGELKRAHDGVVRRYQIQIQQRDETCEGLQQKLDEAQSSLETFKVEALQYQKRVWSAKDAKIAQLKTALETKEGNIQRHTRKPEELQVLMNSKNSCIQVLSQENEHLKKVVVPNLQRQVQSYKEKLEEPNAIEVWVDQVLDGLSMMTNVEKKTLQPLFDLPFWFGMACLFVYVQIFCRGASA